MADGQRHLSFNISENKYGTIHLATDIAITSKGLVDRPKKEIYCHIPLNEQICSNSPGNCFGTVKSKF